MTELKPETKKTPLFTNETIRYLLVLIGFLESEKVKNFCAQHDWLTQEGVPDEVRREFLKPVWRITYEEKKNILKIEYFGNLDLIRSLFIKSEDPWILDLTENMQFTQRLQAVGLVPFPRGKLN